MKILALDTCSKAGSVSLLQDGNLLCHQVINSGRTHSETLLPSITHLLAQANWTLDDIGLFCASQGPGSFTGVRIGLSVMKGLLFGKTTPFIAVSSLEALAYQAIDFDGIIIPLLDARKQQFYTAAFSISNQKVTRLCEDVLIDYDKIEDYLFSFQKKVILVGDGATFCYNNLSEKERVHLPSQNYLIHSSIGVALAAYEEYQQGIRHCIEACTPIYLRLSQAQEERKKRMEE